MQPRAGKENAGLEMRADTIKTQSLKPAAVNLNTITLPPLFPCNARLTQAASGKDKPHNNFFFYDGYANAGMVELHA